MQKEKSLPEQAIDLDKLRNELDKTISVWYKSRKELIYFREIPQFLEIFSSEDVININNKEREIAGILKMLVEIRQAACHEHIELLTSKMLLKTFKKLEEKYWVTQLFIEKHRAKIYDIKPTLGQFLFCPCSTIMFLINKYAHRKLMRGL